MSEIVKWGLLVAGLIAIVSLFSLVLDAVNLGLIALGLSESVNAVTTTLASAFQAGRGVLNHFADPWVWDTLIFVTILYPIYKFAVRRLGWLYSWIFK